MTADGAVEILDRLDAHGIWYCIEGGWGVDALLEQQTRTHDDLDLGVRLEDVQRICAALAAFDRDDAEWPSSFVLRRRCGRRVDCHPLVFDENGDGWQANLHGAAFRWPREHLERRGRIGGREVRCITPELQLRWHAYEDFDDVDWADVGALCARFDLDVPDRLVGRPGFVSNKRSPRANAHRCG